MIEDFRSTPRIQQDDNVSDVSRDGNNKIRDRRKILQRPPNMNWDASEDTSESKRLVQPVSSRRYNKDIQEINTGVRTGLRKRNTKI